MRHVSVILRHPISIGFHGLTGCRRDPRDFGFHTSTKMERLLPHICAFVILLTGILTSFVFF